MGFWESLFLFLLAVFCTPVGWVGIIVLGVAIRYAKGGSF